MNPLYAVAILSMLAAPSSATRATSKAKRGRAVVSVAVDGGRLGISLRDGTTNTEVTLETNGACHAKKLSAVTAREVADNAAAFRGLRGGGVVHPLSGPAAVEQFERGLAQILGRGEFHVEGGRGSTTFAGFDVPLGKLPAAGKSKTVQRSRAAGGPTTVVTGLPHGGAKIVRTIGTPADVVDVSEVTVNGDGSSSLVRTFTHGRGSGAVTLVQSWDFDADGGSSGGLGSVHTGSGAIFTSDQGSGDGGGGDESPTPSGGEGGGGGGQNGETGNPQKSGSSAARNVGDTPSGGDSGPGGGENDENESDQSSGAPSLTTGGGLVVPGLSIGTSTVATVVNYNRLGAAVTNPNPTAGEDTTVTGGGGNAPIGGCGHLDQPGFDPNPQFLQPGKTGWSRDPVPFLSE
jgi:hypothetical protein